MNNLEIAKYNLAVARNNLRVINAMFLRGLAKPSELWQARDEYERCLAEWGRAMREQEDTMSQERLS